MLRRILFLAGAIAVAAANYAWQAYEKSEWRQQAYFDQFAPVLSSMSADAIGDSNWDYTGPLGKLLLRFEPEGKLTVTANGVESTGQWEIHESMLSVSIPGADSPHHGIFRQSVDRLEGASPRGLMPALWSAVRIQ